MKLFYLFIIFFAVVYTSYAQEKNTKTKYDPENNDEYKFIVKSADKYFSIGDYHNALDWYEESLHKDSNNISVLLNTAICHLDLYADLQAIYYLKKANLLMPGFSPDYHFWIASSYHLNLLFDSAVAHYEKYLIENSGHPEKKAPVDKLIMQADLGKKYVSVGNKYDVENLNSPLNSEFSERNPIWSMDYNTLFFSSNRIDGKPKTEITKTGDAYGNIYFSNLKNNKFTYPKPLPGVNKSSTHTELVSIIDNGNKMVILRSEKNKKLYVSTKIDDVWGEPVLFLDENDIPNNFSSVSISPNGTKLVFSTNAIVEGGNFDLFIMDKTVNGEWSKPYKPAENINSVSDENYPYLLNDQTLFFSSKRSSSMGGYDIYKSIYDKETNSWSEPVNLGFPYNSPAEDIFSGLNKRNKFFLVSNRSGGSGEFDILSIKGYSHVKVKGKIDLKLAKDKYEDLEIQFTSADSSINTKVRPSLGNYDVLLPSNMSYEARIFNDNGDLFAKASFMVPANKDDSVLIKNFEVGPNPLQKNNNRLHFSNRYLVKINYDLNKPFNIRGRVINNITGRHQKKSFKIILHDFEDNSIIESIETDTLGRYSFLLSQGKKKNYRLEIIKEDFLPEWITIMAIDSLPKNSNKNELSKNSFNNVSVENYFTERHKIVGRVYFQINNASISAGDQIYLNSIADYLIKNPKQKVIISGYDDITGEKTVNGRISHMRAENVKKYIVQMGIANERIVDKGMGSNFFAAPNEEEINGRDNNRRVEIEVL